MAHELRGVDIDLLRRVGTQAGLSHTAGAHYFDDKAGLFTAYITRGWNAVADELDQAARIVDDRQALLASGTRYAVFAQANPSVFSVLDRLELTNVETPELWAARERGFLQRRTGGKLEQEAN